MTKQHFFTIKTSLIVALGGFLMGFDASVISGVVKFIEAEFNLTKLELGWAVSSLTLTATLAMMIAGPLSSAYGRREILKWAAVFYAVSAIASAVAPDFTFLVIARMLGGFGVGASLIIAPMYIAEISPPKIRGRMVSINQLNIVLGISVAFLTNYIILQAAQSGEGWSRFLKIDLYEWRWMLGIEAFPALLYFICLFFVPKSPRWLVIKGKDEEALEVFKKVSSDEQARIDLAAVKAGIESTEPKPKVPFRELLNPTLRLVMIIGFTIAILQQITGINSVFFYAPMIFEQSGIGTDASFSQAILVGITNLVFTVLAMMFIDKFGRKILLIIGLSGITVSMLVLAWGFNEATYLLTSESIQSLPSAIDSAKLYELLGVKFDSDLEFRSAILTIFGQEEALKVETELITAATQMNSTVILFGIIGFVASFAVSLGPVMWVLFSEIFPNYIRGLAISFVGFINSAVSFIVQLLFPWELAYLGNSLTFLIYGLFAAAGLLIVLFVLPETKGKSLEELEEILIK